MLIYSLGCNYTFPGIVIVHHCWKSSWRWTSGEGGRGKFLLIGSKLQLRTSSRPSRPPVGISPVIFQFLLMLLGLSALLLHATLQEGDPQCSTLMGWSCVLNCSLQFGRKQAWVPSGGLLTNCTTQTFLSPLFLCFNIYWFIFGCTGFSLLWVGFL